MRGTAIPQRILIVDAESNTRSEFERTLRQEGFLVITGSCGREALQVATKETPDLMILDLHVPNLESYEVCRLMRETPQSRTIPILTISMHDPNGLAIQCLNNGADGHLQKQVGRLELIAHVRALLRRPRIYLSEQDVVQKGFITLRPGERRITFQNKDIPSLTPKEYELLKELIFRSPRIVEREGIALKVWGVSFEQLGRKTLDVHIQRLRRKLGPLASSYLKTVSLVGYQWLESPSSHR
jgi:DNA-binding response OmpR family regulator